jgi:hypothetical protein
MEIPKRFYIEAEYRLDNSNTAQKIIKRERECFV